MYGPELPLHGGVGATAPILPTFFKLRPAGHGGDRYAVPLSETLGTSVNVDGGASGGSGSYQYQFWLFNGASWSSRSRTDATNDNTTWDTTGWPPGATWCMYGPGNAGSTAEWKPPRRILPTFFKLSSGPVTGGDRYAVPRQSATWGRRDVDGGRSRADRGATSTSSGCSKRDLLVPREAVRRDER